MQWVSTSSGMLLYHTIYAVECVCAYVWLFYSLIYTRLSIINLSDYEHCNIGTQCFIVTLRAVLYALCTLATSSTVLTCGTRCRWKRKVRKLSFFCCLPGHAFTWWWFKMRPGINTPIPLDNYPLCLSLSICQTSGLICSPHIPLQTHLLCLLQSHIMAFY